MEHKNSWIVSTSRLGKIMLLLSLSVAFLDIKNIITYGIMSAWIAVAAGKFLLGQPAMQKYPALAPISEIYGKWGLFTGNVSSRKSIVSTFLFYNFFGYISILRIFIYFLSIILGIFINFYYSYIFGLISFKITNMWGLSQIMQAITNLLSGALIPIAFFPKWAQSINSFLPFSSAIYTPSMIYLGKISGVDILFALGLQLFWAIVLMIISRKMWKVLIKGLTILGG